MSMREYPCYKDINMIDFWERVKELLTDDLNQSWLCRELDIGTGTMSSWITNERLPKADMAVKIAKALGVSVEYLVTGNQSEEEYLQSNEEIVQTIQQSGRFITPNKKEYELTDNESVVVLSVLDQKISAGPSAEMIEPEYTSGRHITVMKRLVSSFNLDTLRAVEVRGDSMTGISLHHGDTVIFVNQHIEGDGIYVIFVNGEALVKRLEFDPFDNKVRVYSENPRYQSPKVIDADSEIMQIQGKVVAWFHCHPY